MNAKTNKLLGGTPKSNRCPTQNKQRPRYSLSDETLNELEWLYQADQKEANKRLYPSDTLTKIIHEAYVIRTTFRQP
ncbi:hypothetical protein [Enterococcus sp. DIV1420a]|uniref:hypothetical protein n=1 Tax=Enterococcus sp. DIV1420a TaxID=2774672 RepID=UPI003F2686DF